MYSFRANYERPFFICMHLIPSLPLTGGTTQHYPSQGKKKAEADIYPFPRAASKEQLTKEVVDAATLEAFKARLDVALGSLV